ncbi:MAG: hypothetical protein NXH82_04840 [Rhodobacteraceae bacterium]|nr:hypothetical protein [Paracoccaceae bacterium]
MPSAAAMFRRHGALRRSAAVLFAALLLGGAGYGAWKVWTTPTPAQVDAVYATPLPAPDRPMRVFHLGHSLVSRDMPAMLAQLAPAGHGYDSQLGWGTSLQEHWYPEMPILGFDVENDHPRFRAAREAIASGEYDALVMTEMVEIRDAIRYRDSGTYLHKWAEFARGTNPGMRLYLYESWPELDDPEGWLARLDLDLGRYWEERILFHDLVRSRADANAAIHVIPAGQAMAAFVRALEARGGVDNIADRTDLFAKTPEGAQDMIHVNDLGAYLVALTHYAVLYHRSPVGLPHALRRADGTEAVAPGPAAARLMQETVWQVVTRYAKTGVDQAQ